MTYQLIPTDDAAQQRVLGDVACSPDHHLRVSYALRVGYFPSHWAVEAGTSDYLVGLQHEDIRPENAAERYVFSFGGALHEVRLDSIFGSEVTLVPLCGAVIADIPVFREALTRAFAVHGRYGSPKDKQALIPTFGY